MDSGYTIFIVDDVEAGQQAGRQGQQGRQDDDPTGADRPAAAEFDRAGQEQRVAEDAHADVDEAQHVIVGAIDLGIAGHQASGGEDKKAHGDHFRACGIGRTIARIGERQSDDFLRQPRRALAQQPKRFIRHTWPDVRVWRERLVDD